MDELVSEKAYSFRNMTEHDLVAVKQIEDAAYVFPWSETIFRDCLSVGYPSWVMELQGEVIGYSVLQHVVDESHILNICVQPKLQGHGYGRAMLHFILAQARASKTKSVFLEVRPSNIAAIELYESEGFNEIGCRKDYYPSVTGREDALLFALELSEEALI